MAKTPTWQRAEGKNPKGGLNEKGRASLRAAGHDIKRPQPEGGSRRDSFCARMKGMKEKLTSSETANDPDSRINKSLRAWNCHADGGSVDPYDAVQQASGLDRKKRDFGGFLGGFSGGGSSASMFQPQQMSLAQNPITQPSAPAPQQQQSSQPSFDTQTLNAMQFMNPMGGGGMFGSPFGRSYNTPFSPFMGGGFNGPVGGFSPYMFMQNPEANYLRTQNPYMFSGSPFPLNTQSQNQPLPQGVNRNSLLGLLGMIYGLGSLGPFMSYKDGGSVEPYDNVQKAAKGGEVWDKPRPKSLGEPEPLSSKQKASAKAAAKAAGRPYPNLVDNMRAARADGGEVWDRPRPKDLGEPKELSSKKKSKAKAMAKAAGRPYPNLIDNMRAARAQKADGGELEGDVQFLEDDPYGKVQQAAVPMMAREEYAQRMPVEDKADELRRIAQEPSYADLFNAPLKYGVQTMVSPDIAPQRVAKSLVEMPETVKQFGKGLAESAYSGATLPGDVVTGQVDPMSEEGMRRATDLAGLAQTGSFAFTRPAGSLASGASREASAGEPAIAGMGHNQPPVETPIEPPAYQRFLNPAGFYSHGHEVAMTQLPEGPRTWQEMSALLNKGNVKKEELRWAGLLPEAYDPSHKITREEIAQQFERNFPQVEPVWKQNDTRIQEWQNNVRNAQSQLAKAEQAIVSYNDHGSRNPFYSVNDADWIHKARQIKAAIREGSTPIEKLPPEFQEAAAAYKRDFEDLKAANRNYDYVRQLPAPESVYEKPKWESYTYPGGSDYKESILKIPYNDPRAQTKIHPEIAQKYAQEQENLNAKFSNLNEEYAKQRTIDVKKYNDAIYAFEQRYYDAVLNAALKDGYSPEDAMAVAKRLRDNTPYDGMGNYLGEKRPNLYDFDSDELENIQKELYKTKDALDLLRTKQIDESKPLFNIPAYTSELYQHTTHLGDIENPLLHQRWKERLGPQGEKILSNEEFQSDWGQTGKEHGFKDLAIDEKRILLNAEIMNTVDESRLLAKTAGEEFDAQSPLVQAYREKHKPTWEKFEKSRQGNTDLETYNRESAEDMDYVHSLGLGTWDEHARQRSAYIAQRTMENDARLQQLRQELDSLPETGETPLAPHIGSNEQWIELGAKHALSHAIENGHDKIFIMGGQEHARRYGTELRKAVDNIEWIKPDNDANLKNWRDLRAKQIYGKESSYDSLPQEIKNQIDEKAASLQQFQPNVKTVYATPKGGGSRNYFIVDKDGKVVDSDIYDAKPKKGKKISLASVIGGDLAKRVMNEESGNVPMANYIMGSEGYTQHYERKVPSIYKDIIKKYLKVSPKVEAGPLMERDEKFGKAVPGTGQMVQQPDGSYNIVYPDGSFRSGFRQDTAQAILNMEAGRAQAESARRERMLADRAVQFRDSHSQGQLNAIIPGYLQMEPIEQSNAIYKYLEDLEKSGVKRGPQGTYIHITPEMREAYNKIKREKGAVFPGYKQGGKVVNKPDPYDNVRKAAKIFPRAQRAFH